MESPAPTSNVKGEVIQIPGVDGKAASEVGIQDMKVLKDVEDQI